MILTKTKNRIIVLFLVLLFIPFLTLTNFYPFMRFSMFAEPARAKAVPTTYFLKINTKINTEFIHQDLFHQLVHEHKSTNNLKDLALKFVAIDLRIASSSNPLCE